MLIYISMCWLKNICTAWELWVKFYLGQNEDYSPGDRDSDSSEELLQRGGGKVSIICDFSEGGMFSQAHMWAEAWCWSREAGATVNDFSALLDTRRCKNLGS